MYKTILALCIKALKIVFNNWVTKLKFYLLEYLVHNFSFQKVLGLALPSACTLFHWSVRLHTNLSGVSACTLSEWSVRLHTIWLERPPASSYVVYHSSCLKFSLPNKQFFNLLKCSYNKHLKHQKPLFLLEPKTEWAF